MHHRPPAQSAGTKLYTTDLDGGFELLPQLFGWTKVSDMDMGSMRTSIASSMKATTEEMGGFGGDDDQSAANTRLMLELLLQR